MEFIRVRTAFLPRRTTLDLILDRISITGRFAFSSLVFVFSMKRTLTPSPDKKIY
jgi:hypothetical protein